MLNIPRNLRPLGYIITALVSALSLPYFLYFEYQYDPYFWPVILSPLYLLSAIYAISGCMLWWRSIHSRNANRPASSFQQRLSEFFTVFLLATVITVMVAIYTLPNFIERRARDTTTLPIISATLRQELNRIFNMKNKQPNTKLFYSDQLGVGFTYTPHEGGRDIVITQEKSYIFIHEINKEKESGKVIEFFTKDPAMNLEEAIISQLLANRYEQKIAS